MPGDDKDKDKTFSQDDVNRIVQTRLAADRASRGTEEASVLQSVNDLKLQLASEQAKRVELDNKFAQTSRDQIVGRVVAAKNLPASLSKFIHGNTEEEITASATELLAAVGPGQSVGGETNPAGATVVPRVYTADELKSMAPEDINKDWENIAAQMKSGTVK